MSSKLSPREIEIINYFGNGLSIKEISDMLVLSFYTVDTHRKNLLVKFNARNLPHAVKLAAEAGVLNIVGNGASN